jgi:hypothetical protein
MTWGEQSVAVSDADGWIRVADVGADAFHARVSAPGRVGAGIFVPPSKAAPIVETPVLARAFPISGWVTWCDGTPAAGVDVEAEGQRRVETDASGHFRIEELPDGEHLVLAGEDHGWRWGGIHGVRAWTRGGTEDLRLVLPELPPERPRRGGVVRPFGWTSTTPDGAEAEPVVERTWDTEAVVTVLDDAGAPLEGARVRFWRCGGFVATDSSGQARIRGWPPGETGDLDVSPPDRDPDLLTTEIEGWRPRDVVLRLVRGLSMSGVVHDPQGHPVADAEVSTLEPDGTWEARAKTDHVGTFHLRALPAGTVRLRAALPLPGFWFSKPTAPPVSHRVGASRTARAGEQVVLELDPGPGLRVRFPAWPDVSPTLDAQLVEEDPSPRWPASAPVTAKGEAKFARLDPERTYSLWVGPLLDGRYAYARGLRGGPEVQEISLERGRRTTVTVTGARGLRATDVRAKVDEFAVRATPMSKDAFEFWGLPEGTWVVYPGDLEVEGEVSVRAGDHATLEVRPSAHLDRWEDLDPDDRLEGTPPGGR